MNFRGELMIYLDYSATTPVSKHVLDESYRFHQAYFANPNSIHKLGRETHQLMVDISKQIQKDLQLFTHQVVYTSGATESNNLAIKGLCYRKGLLGKHIITSPFEHGSIVAVLNDLANKGFEVDVVDVDEYGRIDLKDLQALMTDETVLVSIGLVNSELGIVQDLSAIRTVIDAYPNVVFHSDMTQAIGKVRVDYQLADLISLSAHKLYGFKGVGALLVKNHLKLEPLIHGGKSLSPLRGGTPAIGLIHALGLAIEDAYEYLDDHIKKVTKLKDYLLDALRQIEGVVINSNQYSLAHIVNFSFLRTDGLSLQKYLSDHDIFVSTTSACSSGESLSRVVFALTNDRLRAMSSIRVSLSHLTSKDELKTFVNCLEAYHEGC